MSARTTWILLLCLVGCGERGGQLSAPSPTAAARGHRAVLEVRVHPTGPTPLGLWNPRDGRSWRGAGPWTLEAGPVGGVLELRAMPDDAGWCRLLVPWFVERPPSQLLLLPRLPLPDSVYAQALDLCVEAVMPYDAGIVRRWSRTVLRVSRPAEADSVEAATGVDYLGPLEDALQTWNRQLGRERFRLVDAGDEAEVVCELSQETRLGYVQRLRADAEGHPLLMRIHLSPRWGVGTERYVRRAWLHELGHVLGFWGHSQDPRHLMHGRFIAVEEAHPEELLVLDWIWSLPHGTHMGWYRRVCEPSGEAGARPEATVEQASPLTPPPFPRADGTVACRPAPN